MASYQLISWLVVLATLFAYVNDRFIKWPPTIGILSLSLTSSVLLIACGHLYPSLAQSVKTVMYSIDFEVVLMKIMLGFLLFAGSIQLDFALLKTNALPVLMLSVLGTLISTVLVGVMTYLLLQAVLFSVPFIACLLFGALISPTDPIAVMAILKSSGLPQALQIKITGESLFNDGLAVVLFISLLDLVSSGGGQVSGANFAVLFAREALGGMLFGLVLAALGYYVLRSVDNYRLEILITLSMVMGGYAVADYLHVSGPLAMVVCGLAMGSQKLAQNFSLVSRDYLEKFWHLLDELLNTLLFLLIGLELLIIEVHGRFLFIGLALVVCVLAARLVSVWIPIQIMKPWFSFERYTVPLLTWGGLRGGLSVAMALSLPQSPYRATFILLTYVIVIFSILVQGLSIEPLAKRLFKTRHLKPV